MGDKNNLQEVGGSDLLIKTGHGILKSVYVNNSDRVWIIRDGISVSGAVIMTINGTAAANGSFSLPYINHPFRDGLFVDNTTAGAVGTIILVYE